MEQPIRATFTGRNTVNNQRSGKENVKPTTARQQGSNFTDASCFEPIKNVSQDTTYGVKPTNQQNENQIPIQHPIQIEQLGDDVPQIQESLDLALLKMQQNAEEKTADGLQGRLQHTEAFLASNREAIDALKENFLEQREGQYDVAQEETVEGALLKDARSQQIMEREVLQGLWDTQNEQMEEVKNIAAEFLEAQVSQEKELEKLDWQHASLYTQLLEVEEHSKKVERVEEIAEEGIQEDRVDIQLMMAQHETHRGLLAKQEIDMERLETTQECARRITAEDLVRVETEIASVSAIIEEFDGMQGLQFDFLRNSEMLTQQLTDTTSHIHNITEGLAQATDDINRGHEITTTLVRQQDVVEAQERTKVEFDIQNALQENANFVARYLRHKMQGSERVSFLGEKISQLSAEVREVIQGTKEFEKGLAAERARAKDREFRVAEAAAFALKMVDEFVVEVNTLMRESQEDVKRLDRVVDGMKMQSQILIGFLREDNEVTQRQIKLADQTIAELESKIEFWALWQKKKMEIQIQMNNLRPVVGGQEIGTSEIGDEGEGNNFIVVNLGPSGEEISCEVFLGDEDLPENKNKNEIPIEYSMRVFKPQFYSSQ